MEGRECDELQEHSDVIQFKGTVRPRKQKGKFSLCVGGKSGEVSSSTKRLHTLVCCDHRGPAPGPSRQSGCTLTLLA